MISYVKNNNPQAIDLPVGVVSRFALATHPAVTPVRGVVGERRFPSELLDHSSELKEVPIYCQNTCKETDKASGAWLIREKDLS